MSNNLSGENIWLTGASSGIGKELLEMLLENKANVFATSRNLESLAPLKQRYLDQLILVPADVADPESVKNCISEICNKVKCLDRIILDAGLCYYLEMPRFESKIFQQNFAVNFFGVVNCIEQALPLLMKAKAPHIIGVSSAVAYLPIPKAEAYGASKAAVLYMLRCLQAHQTTVNIDVTVICPGFVDTPLTAKNTFPMPFIISSKNAAKHMLNGIVKRKKEISFPFRLVFLFKLVAILPDRLRIYIVGRTVKKQ